MTPSMGTPEAPVAVALIENSIGLSGSTLSLGALVRHLDQRRFTPHVVVSRDDQAEYLRDHLGAGARVTRIAPRAGLKGSGWASRSRGAARAAALIDTFGVTLPYAAALRRYLRRHRIALVHQNNGFDVAAVTACRLLRIPLVGYQRGDEWDSWLVRRLAPLIERYIANSEATKRSLIGVGVAPATIDVVYPPIDFSTFQPRGGGADVRRRYGVDLSAPSFGIVGQLQEWKGQRIFLEAARRVLESFPEARPWVIGGPAPGGEAYARDLAGEAQRLGIVDRVVFTGFLNDVPAALEALDVVVHASIQPEPFGRVIVEAMGMGKPVVASDAGGPREIIEHGRSGLLVPPGDDQALGVAIARLLGDRVLAAELGEAGRRDALRRFSAEQHARQVEAIYSMVLAAGRSRYAQPRAAAIAPRGGSR